MRIAKIKIKKFIKKVILNHEIWKKIIGTPYWYLFPEERLTHDIHQYKKTIQKPVIITQDENWKVFIIGEYTYYWPAEYEENDLHHLYVEVFAPSAINAHAYENRWVNIQKDDWVVDAGASEGFFIRYALLKNANVLAIEPIPRLAQALCLTYEKEIREGKVIILNMGLGEKTSVSQLQINQQQICSSIVSEGTGEDVNIISLDEFMEMKVIPSVQFIKMDIEGGEISAILGAKKVIKEYKPKLSIAVYHSYKNALILRKFIRNTQPKYRVKFRGVFNRAEYGPPRPYILFAK
jgi:FkbM family methyltransferase